MNSQFLSGFSKLPRDEKIRLIISETDHAEDTANIFRQHWHDSEKTQKIYESFSENTLTNYYLPFGIAPNFLINDRLYHIPMVTEESSVIAAAASAAKFWYNYGGFRSMVISHLKRGNIYFEWQGQSDQLIEFLNANKYKLIRSLEQWTSRMESRGGGIRDIQLIPMPSVNMCCYKLDVTFDTADAMGANFINTCLEQLASEWIMLIESNNNFAVEHKTCNLIMSILSNYNPECLVKSEVRVDVENLNQYGDTNFTDRFLKAFKIAQLDISRAVTHNKGIMNGVDAVLLSTGNDFRAVEAGAHAYASKGGQYRSLSKATIENNELVIDLTIPLTVGTVGGLTSAHPLARKTLEILGSPSAKELMEIISAVGLASNFSAVKSLVTGGIQKGHMKLHLVNILESYNASETEKSAAVKWFQDKKISHHAVHEYLIKMRSDEQS